MIEVWIAVAPLYVSLVVAIARWGMHRRNGNGKPQNPSREFHELKESVAVIKEKVSRLETRTEGFSVRLHDANNDLTALFLRAGLERERPR